MAYSVYDSVGQYRQGERVDTHQLSYNNNPKTNIDNAILPPQQQGGGARPGLLG